MPAVSTVFQLFIPGAGGYFEPADRPGLAGFTAALMREGKATWTSEQISQQLEVMAARPHACRVLLADISRAGRIPELAVAIGDAFLLPVARLLAEGRTDGSIDSSVDEEATSALIYGAVTVTGLHYLVAHESLDAGRVGDLVAGLLNRGLRAR